MTDKTTGTPRAQAVKMPGATKFIEKQQFQWILPALYEGGASSYKLYEGPAETKGDIRLHVRYYTYRTDAGLVVGRTNSDMFTIARRAKDVWQYIKDFNLWQNLYGFHYSGVVGELEGQIYAMNTDPEDFGPNRYQVLKVVPEHLIAIGQPVPEDDRVAEAHPGIFGPGFHLIMLHEHGGETTVTIYTEHAYRTKTKSEEEALGVWKAGAQELLIKFRDSFIPTIKKLVQEGQKSIT